MNHPESPLRPRGEKLHPHDEWHKTTINVDDIMVPVEKCLVPECKFYRWEGGLFTLGRLRATIRAARKRR